MLGIGPPGGVGGKKNYFFLCDSRALCEIQFLSWTVAPPFFAVPPSGSRVPLVCLSTNRQGAAADPGENAAIRSRAARTERFKADCCLPCPFFSLRNSDITRLFSLSPGHARNLLPGRLLHLAMRCLPRRPAEMWTRYAAGTLLAGSNVFSIIIFSFPPSFSPPLCSARPLGAQF